PPSPTDYITPKITGSTTKSVSWAIADSKTEDCASEGGFAGVEPPSFPALRGGIGRVALPQHRLDELLGDEIAEVFGALADAHVPHRKRVLGDDAEDHATLGGSVQLREDDPGERQRLLEHRGLLHGVLAVGRVEHEQRLVWRALLRLGHGLRDLGQLIHQV